MRLGQCSAWILWLRFQLPGAEVQPRSCPHRRLGHHPLITVPLCWGSRVPDCELLVLTGPQPVWEECVFNAGKPHDLLVGMEGGKLPLPSPPVRIQGLTWRAGPGVHEARARSTAHGQHGALRWRCRYRRGTASDIRFESTAQPRFVTRPRVCGKCGLFLFLPQRRGLRDTGGWGVGGLG